MDQHFLTVPEVDRKQMKAKVTSSINFFLLNTEPNILFSAWTTRNKPYIFPTGIIKPYSM